MFNKAFSGKKLIAKHRSKILILSALYGLGIFSIPLIAEAANYSDLNLISHMSQTEKNIKNTTVNAINIDIHHQHPAYTVNTYNNGRRIVVVFSHTRIPSQVALQFEENHPFNENSLIENVLTVNKAGAANLEFLLKNRLPISVSLTPAGYRLAFIHNTAISKKNKKPTTVAAVSTLSPHSALSFSNITSINGFKFTRGQKNAGVAEINISGKEPHINTQREGNNLVLTLKNTHVDRGYRHIYGTTQFGTLVNSVEMYPLINNAKVVLHNNAKYFYSVYELGHKIIIHISPEKKKINKDVMNSARLSMNFQNIQVRDVLSVISQFTHKNIVVANDVTGRLTIRLKNEPWKEAFNVILQSQGLAVKKIGNILWVAPASVISSQEAAELKAYNMKRTLEPLETVLVPIKYAKAAAIAHLLEGFKDSKNSGALNNVQQQSLASALGLPKSHIIGNSLLGARGTVAVVTRNNSLLIRDTPTDINNIENLIKKIDKPVPQVLIKARIVQITTNAAHSLGINWGGTYTGTSGGSVINVSGTGVTGTTETQGGSYAMQGGSSDSASGSSGFTVPAIANLSASSAGTALASDNPASLGFAIGNTVGSHILDLQLQALQVNNRAKIISSPKVLTEDNEKALIEQGQEIPYQQSTSSGATSVSFKKAELRLAVTPHISPNGKIILTLTAQNNQPNYAEALPSGIPIQTQEVKTKLMVNNGQTIAVGGIYTDTTTKNHTGVPVLKDIPLLGYLFRSEVHSVAKTELLVFITPEIIGKNN